MTHLKDSECIQIQIHVSSLASLLKKSQMQHNKNYIVQTGEIRERARTGQCREEENQNATARKYIISKHKQSTTSESNPFIQNCL